MIALARPRRSNWVVTLADLALLLVGFFAMVQAVSGRGDKAKAEMTAGLRAEFLGQAPEALTVDINRVTDFAGYDRAALAQWARAASADPRSHIVVSGYGANLAAAAAHAEAIADGLSAEGFISERRIEIEAHRAAGRPRVDIGVRFQ
ncbi:hypothetical protein [Sphingomonas sp. ID0503]|uniref:hypothetical protein n=1 Tax=Sphingomonas sp. ID0503 TaxID=3399691 RepID=UPI003AFA7948